ncbi:MAG: GGDEF domain-containing protein [Planctomycetes bacterium]|nr:GGDEF domain-containing protein [Planctomycetota bacterium]
MTGNEVGATGRWFLVGSRAAVREQLAAWFGRPPASAPLAAAGAGDVVVVDARAAGDDVEPLAFGHVFAGVRELKQTAGLIVYVVVDAGDRIGVQLARFCLADGTFAWHDTERRLDAGAIEAAQPTRRQAQPRRPSVDDLLRRVEGHVGTQTAQDSALQRLLQFERDDRLLHKLQDAETGLFDGPYATLKLDEEWKRAMRFHQPLALLLVDLGAGFQRLPEPDRRQLLAEAAGVFLNECRDIDVLARFSPSVFLLLLPGTGPDGAEVLAQRTLAALAERLPVGAGLRLAAGLCTVPDAEIPDRKAFLAVADACLRKAAASGAGGLCTSWQ